MIFFVHCFSFYYFLDFLDVTIFSILQCLIILLLGSWVTTEHQKQSKKAKYIEREKPWSRDLLYFQSYKLRNLLKRGRPDHTLGERRKSQIFYSFPWCIFMCLEVIVGSGKCSPVAMTALIKITSTEDKVINICIGVLVKILQVIQNKE